MTSTSEAVQAEIETIQDEINLHEGLLNSLESGTDTESEEARTVERRTLKKLRKKLGALAHPLSQSAVPDPAQTVASARTMNPDEHQHLMPPPTFDLVSRKRQRGDFDDDDARSAKSAKSARQSPSPSATAGASPVASADTPDSLVFDDDDDPLFADLTGGLSREERREERRQDNKMLASLKERQKREDERKKQEEADAEFARRMQAEFDQELLVATAGPVPYGSQSQSLIRPNGSISHSKPVPSPYPTAVKPAINRFDATPPSFGGSLPSTPSDNSIQEISRANFPARPPSVMSIQNALAGPSSRPTTYTPYTATPYPSTKSVPGAFPGPPQYGSMGGTLVYNATPNGVTSSMGNSRFPFFGTGVGNALRNVVGSLFDPIDLDRYSPSIPTYSDPAKTQEEIRDLLKNIRPDEELTEEQKNHVPPGLKPELKLMPHQALGVGWMKKMEEGTNKGAILADDMGLGKTLQTIALILSRPAPANDRRPNLIVAPVALLEQWKREIAKFVLLSHRLSVKVLHGTPRVTKYNTIRNYDVILTTYGTLGSELKRRIVFEDRLKRDPEARPTPKEECALLGDRSKFHRVILDEAQNVKNRNTQASHAACRINATYRWCLSGTPMQNNVEEMYSLIKFLRIRPYNDWTQFSRDFSRPLKSRNDYSKDRAMEQLQALLKAILLRRTKTSKIEGKPILQLPPKTTVEDRAVFNEDERVFYKALEAKAQIQFNRYVQNGSVGQNYSHALVLLLRLRQACCHPFLVSKSNDFLFSNLGNLEPTDMIANAKQLSDEVIERLKEMDGFECAVCMDAHENPVIFECGHGLCEDCLAKLCDQALSSEEGSKASCPHCRAKIDASKTTNYISFLRVHCPDRDGVEPLGEDDASDSDTDSDTSDDNESDDGEDLKDFIVDDDADIEYNSADSQDRKPKKSKKHKSRKDKKGKGREKTVSLAQLRKEGLKSKLAKRKYLKKLAKDFVPSTKIEKTIKLLEEIRDRGEGEKTIVFSSFTSFLDLLEVPLSQHADFKIYGRYDGSMTPAERNDAVVSFTENKHCKVILVSLKAGNAGLNLTAANHVVIMDPFWNPFVEYQAADRAYRIGQMKEVTIHRLLIGETEEATGPLAEEAMDYTVEDRILKLQEKKRALVESALDERAGQNIGRLGARELGYLFGVNGLDQDRR
jgi:SNF2 family DNA or RNA helicase